MCGEEDCKRCGDLDVDEPCIGMVIFSFDDRFYFIIKRIKNSPNVDVFCGAGKTDCSVCHSTNGVLCRACLKVRYGEG